MVNRLDKSQHARYATQEVPSPDAKGKPHFLCFKFENGLSDSEITLRSSLVFGRGNADSPVDVDLTSFGGQEQGVSRLHLTLIQQGAKIYIKDMGSSNGSYLNEQHLIPHSFYELSDGDSIKLGLLVFKVQFIYAKKSSEKPSVKPHKHSSPNYDLDKTYSVFSQIKDAISSDDGQDND